MKVALVCDWLTELGGAEKVLLAFHELYPGAPIYTSQYCKRKTSWFNGLDIRTGWLQYFPVWTRRLIAPLRQKYFTKLDLSDYDLVISITGCDAKFIQKIRKHICYCHVPTQYYWGKYDEYFKNPGFGPLNPLVRLIFKNVAPSLRQKDLIASKFPDHFITISEFAKQEIKTFYKREAKVISPPVNIDIFAQAVDNYNIKKGKSQMKKSYNKTMKNKESQVEKSEQKFCTNLKNVENLSVLAETIAKHPNGFYLNFSRQVNWKRLDLAVKACKKLDLDLVLIGNGPEHSHLKSLAKGFDRISFIDHLPQSDLPAFAALAKAFIFPSEEPFGIAPVEALAAGCPVIAYQGGGALDFLKDGKNGLFFKAQTELSLIKALKKFEKPDFSLDPPVKISASVKKFAAKIFHENIQKTVIEVMDKKSQKNHHELKQASRSSLSQQISDSASDIENAKKFTSEKIKHALVLSLPVVLFFSNFPLIFFGENSSMHFKLNLPLLWLAIFSILSLKTAIKYFKTHLKTPLLGFPLILIISLFHSTNPIRALLTFCTAFCLIISVIGLVEFFKSLGCSKIIKTFGVSDSTESAELVARGAKGLHNQAASVFLRKLRKIFLTSTVIVSLFCLLQLLADAFGFSRRLTGICQNCGANVFGFPHANGFAIEPQFMGSLLIVPLFLALNSLLENKNNKSQIKISILIFTTLFLTLSRGAIFATAIALFFLLISLKNFKKALKIIAIAASSLILALVFQGFLATIGPTGTTFEKAVSTSVNQLTLGKIDLEASKAQNIKSEGSPAPVFSGYVVESTNRRLELSAFALKITAEHPTNTLFGTGLGSAGTEMYVRAPEKQGHEKEIVQNQYLETLLEIGLVGVILFILSLITFLKLEHFNFEPYTVAIIIAFLVSLCFFSGFPSALHIYLLPVLCYNLMYGQDRLSRTQKRNYRHRD